MKTTWRRSIGQFLCLSITGYALTPITGSCATYTVTNTTDAGAGSLRQAIIDANNNAGDDLIHFRISGPKPYTITPLSVLPSITDPVTIDGTTQTNFTGQPIIQLNGTSAGPNANGLLLLAGNSTVRGLVMNRFKRSAIRIEGNGTNVIQGNYLGTDVNGTNNSANDEGGVYIYQSPGNLIGGPNAAARNILSGGNLAGIFIENPSAIGNRVQGNYIGTDVSGTKRLGNKNNGIVLATSSGNIIGGTSPAERNIISGNQQSGIYLLSASGNWIAGNYIGTDVTGSLAVSNVSDGVTLFSANNNLVGGTNAGARNLISANGEFGVFITNGAVSNQVQGNYVGTAASGAGSLGNQFSGIGILGASSNLVGGTSASARNVISANKQSGIWIGGTGVRANVVQGNYIGTDYTGTNALGNTLNGVALSDFASNNIVGGAAAGAGNVISANLQTGVYIFGNGARSNSVQGNWIGTDRFGVLDLGNALSGVRIESPANTIGGVQVGAGNIISGNTENGVYLFQTGASNNIIQGNYIGTDASGTVALPNNGSGIGITNAKGNIIGGAAAGAGNLISGNSRIGIYLESTGAFGNVMQGNFIGTDISGTTAIPNGLALPIMDVAGGIDISSSPSNLIGGTVTGAGNLISGNIRNAIAIGNAGSTGNVIQGNLIGTQIDGLSPLGNEWHGVEIRGSPGGGGNTIIGGTEPGAGNVLAYATLSQRSGVRIRDGIGNTGVLVRGNSIFFNGSSGTTGFAIDIGDFGVNLNDNCDSDSGGNLHQNFPVLTNAQSTGTITIVQGTLNSAANKTYLLQFYASAVPEPSGNVEGKTYLGDASVSIGASCNAAFTVQFTNVVTAGQWITATATDPANNTSEFSAEVMVSSPITITSQPVSRTNVVGTTATFSVTVNGTPPLSYQWRKNLSTLNNGGNVSGATTTNLILFNVSPSDAANYSVVITNSSGSVTSSIAALTVVSPPRITTTRSGNSITLSWPQASAGFAAQQTTNLVPPISWALVTNTPVLAGGQYTLTITPTSRAVFYRLVLQ